jgi:hypothetical protein
MSEDETLVQRVRSLESWRHNLDVQAALWQKDKEHIDGRFDRQEARLDKIDGHLNKLVWLIIGALVSGAVLFVMKGGLASVS